MARLYGVTLNNGSHAVVTRGFREVLLQRGELDGLVALDMHTSELISGALAPRAIWTGPLHLLELLTVGTKHKERWVVVAPNSTHLPQAIVHALKELRALALAPSAWALEILESYGLPAVLARHGVSGLAQVDRTDVRETYQHGQFQVVHMSTSAGQRKGTVELLQGWARAVEHGWVPAKASLFVILDHAASLALQERLADEDLIIPPRVTLASRVNFKARELMQLYGNVHLVCQPSRGEAFGLVPLEALACGVPVAATNCTGHVDHVRGPGVVVIPHGRMQPMDDGPGAQAPGVEADDIAEALRIVHERWAELDAEAQNNSARVREQWSWGNQLKSLFGTGPR
jgi:hypothetical protein